MASARKPRTFRRQLWQSPRLHDNINPRGVGWLELFFDLFFVAVIAQLVHSFSEHFDLAGLRTFILLFIPIWWVWIGATYYSERFETEGIETRLYTYLLMLPILGLAVYAHHGMSSSYVGFVLSYAAARSIIMMMWGWATITSLSFRPTGKRYLAGFSVAIVLILLSTVVAAPLRFILFGTALIIEMLAPITTMGLQAKLPPYSKSKLPERFGLFTIIVLGEMVVGMVNGLSNLAGVGVALFVYAALGVAVGLGWWWLYFDFIARRRPRVGIRMFIWSYGHLPLVMSIAALGAGITHVIATEKTIEPGVQTLIGGCMAVAFVSLALLELTLEPKPDEPTHPIISPSLKLLSGVAAAVIGFTYLDLYPTVFLLLLIALLLINMVYGLWVWFRQPLTDAHSELSGELPL